MSKTELADVILLGKMCAVGITGCPEDADDITTFEGAMQAIRAALEAGKKSHNELNSLRMDNH